jgi:hypothetical protein
MSNTKNHLYDTVEQLGEYLESINAHYARTMFEYATIGATSPYTEQELELAYRVGVSLLYAVSSARRGNAVPEFAEVYNTLGDYAAAIAATPPSQERY